MPDDIDWNHPKTHNEAPGGKLARAHGCTCPVLDNHFGRLGFRFSGGWYMNEDCPLHGQKVPLQ